MLILIKNKLFRYLITTMKVVITYLTFKLTLLFTNYKSIL